MRASTLLLLSVLVLVVAETLCASEKPISFNRDIRPILSDNCFSCHGFDSGTRKAKLRLDTREGATAENDGVIAIVPGNVEKSELWLRILSEDEEEVMPPPKTHKKVTAAQKDLLKRWINEGARYEAHWSFVPPVKPAAGSSIDDFIRAELPKRGLKPAPLAEAGALVRRVALDLTGLPPTLEEQRRFASAEAYSEMVDYFLAKPAFGEHMAVAWLDAARYADTNGYQVDRDRELWPWRDWVVRALNANLPFDQFTIEQLAGDLLPNSTLDQKIATGFHRNHMLNEEGGIIAEEFLAEYTADRVETTAAVWLGQTFNCCRCHDHKYDPFTQRDFYAMKAYFHNVPELGVGVYKNPIRTNAPPYIKLPTLEIEAKLAALNAKLKPIEDQLKKAGEADIERWAQSIATAKVEWQALKPVMARGGAQPPKLTDEVITISPQEARANDIQITAKLPPGKLTALRLECATSDAAATIQWSGLKVGKAKLRALETEHAKVLENQRKQAPLSVAPGKPAQAIFELETPLEGQDVVITFGVGKAGGTTKWRVFATVAAHAIIAPENIVEIAKIEPAKRTEPQRKQLTDYRLSSQPEHRRQNEEANALRKQIAAAEADIPTTLVMEEQKEPRATFVLMRGAYDKPGEQVTAATPAVLPKPSGDLPANRLGLARWLVSRENPLTARVTVNRFWQQFFGAGLVRSSEDFGSQGDQPSHPELLDWLAVSFQESGWDVKRLIKLIVTSETYRQSARRAADATREIDPINTWLARGPRHRLPAEVIRDQALAVSGLLVGKIGGPTVKPYHPLGLYEQVVSQRDNPNSTYKQGSGEDLHRRSLYTYWKRSVPHPAMMLFDAPFREVCAMRRTRSNTPLQALNLLNDPTYVEAARFLAQRMIREGGATNESRVKHGFQLLLARAPSPQELKILTASLVRMLADFQRDPQAATQLLAFGETKNSEGIAPSELAAFTTLASTLLNLDETISNE